MCILSSACANQQQSAQPLPAIDQNRTSVPATAKTLAEFPPATLAEVVDAVDRVFKKVVTIEPNRHPSFITGDFNGDFSQDLAITIKPVPSKLLQINDELASWILVDPIQHAISDAKAKPYQAMHARILKQQPVQVTDGDLLLAVIHGFESNGWRDHWATQTYLLKGAAGDDLKVVPREQVVTAKNEQKMPLIRGDVIAQTHGGQSGFLYFNGGKYAWYDPKIYKPLPPGRLVHARKQ
ncbi:MAG: hypothetical protein L0220_24160 [Acidobacteria bacterium]|nr:hypothetical protein [Acidobacteriota bacterium]